MELAKGQSMPPEHILADVREWIANCGFRDVWVHSNEEWKARGETMGDNSVLTIACDGGFCSALNQDVCMDKKPFRDLRDLVESHGYFFEMGYHWTLHLYPINFAGSEIVLCRA